MPVCLLLELGSYRSNSSDLASVDVPCHTLSATVNVSIHRNVYMYIHVYVVDKHVRWKSTYL